VVVVVVVSGVVVSGVVVSGVVVVAVVVVVSGVVVVVVSGVMVSCVVVSGVVAAFNILRRSMINPNRLLDIIWGSVQGASVSEAVVVVVVVSGVVVSCVVVSGAVVTGVVVSGVVVAFNIMRRSMINPNRLLDIMWGSVQGDSVSEAVVVVVVVSGVVVSGVVVTGVVVAWMSSALDLRSILALRINILTADENRRLIVCRAGRAGGVASSSPSWSPTLIPEACLWIPGRDFVVPGILVCSTSLMLVTPGCDECFVAAPLLGTTPCLALGLKARQAADTPLLNVARGLLV
jgi:hypothetical protein